MQSQRVEFTGASGGRLAGRLDLPPDGAPLAYALFAHCFTCSKDLRAAVNISRELNRHRIAVLRFDFTGLGESEGEFAETTFTSNVGDLVAAADFLALAHAPPRILIGHSLGGAAVLQAAGRLASVVAVVTIGAPYDPVHVTHLFADSRDRIEAQGEAAVVIAGRRFRVTKQFLDDLEATRVDQALERLGRALLIFHSPVDAIVGIENAARIYQAAKHPKSFVSLDRADHLLSDEADSRYVAAVLAAWASRYIAAPPPPPLERLAAENRVVTRTGRGFRTEIAAGGHGLVADEPVAVGGTDAGPGPYDYLATALGACTGMTLRMYADRKGWPLEEVTVRLRHDRVHATDGAECDAGGPCVDRLDREVELAGPLDAPQRARLLEIANRCPVHRTLEAGVRVSTRLASRVSL